MKFGFDLVSEKKVFEYYGHIHVYSPGAGADNPPGAKISVNINLLSICLFPVNFTH